MASQLGGQKLGGKKNGNDQQTAQCQLIQSKDMDALAVFPSSFLLQKALGGRLGG